MSKTKSVVMTVIISIVIVLLSLMCIVNFDIPFRWFGVYKSYDSVVSVISYGPDLGGGRSAMYYPEGVISAESYDAQLGYLKEKISEAEEKDKDEDVKKFEAERKEFEEKYVAYVSGELSDTAGQKEGAVLYMENDKACVAQKDGEGYEILSAFEKNFEQAIKVITKRFDAKNLSYLSIAKVNDYSIRVEVPGNIDDEGLFAQMAYSGDFRIRPSDQAYISASEYFSKASFRSNGSDGYVQLELTTEGKEKIKNITNALKDDDTDKTLYFFIGEQQLIGLQIDDVIDQRTLYIGGSSFTPEAAQNVGIVIDSCLNYGSMDMTLSLDDASDFENSNSNAVLTSIFVIFAAAIALMGVYSVIRYKGLGVTHIFGVLSFLSLMLMFIAFLPNMIFTASGMMALALTCVLCILSNYYVFENVRKEFSVGKTLNSAIKDGYKASYAGILDTHILLFVLGLVLYFISIGELVSFAFIFLLGVLMSGIVSLVVTRFYWYCMRGLVMRSVQYKFCGFKREVIDDDED